MTTVHPSHPHSLVLELAFGDGVLKTSVGQSMGATVQAAIEIYSDRHCLGIRDREKDNEQNYSNSYSWLTYKTVGDRATNFGHGLRQLIEPRSYLGICGTNRLEWVIVDWACMFHSMVSVPITALSSDREMIFILNNTKISLVVCDKEMLPKFVRVQTECPSLCHVVCMDPLPLSIKSKSTSLSIHQMDDIENRGCHRQYAYVKTEPNDCLTIIYTSGSSGAPKGVMISDRAFRSLFPEEVSPFTGEFIIFSYQSLAWYGGRNNLYATFLAGGRAGFHTGDASRLMEELNLIRPTMFAAPPSIWNQIFAEFKAALALAVTSDLQENDRIEKQLLKKFSKLIPLRCRTIAIVGALISPIVRDFIRRCFVHCVVQDAYGITECGGVAFDNSMNPSVSYRLESVPEMGFTTNDKPFPRGELLTKTIQMFSGYVNNPTETRLALTEDGFFRTGDIVELRPVPFKPPIIHILDRKKNFFKLSQGQFVSPEYLQGVFSQSSFIDQIYIHGDLLEDCVIAVVIPNRDRAQAFAATDNLKSLEYDPKFYTAIMRDLHSIGTKASLRKHEIPSRIVIDFEPFTVENGLLTASLKPCRPKLAAHYSDRLKATSNIEQRLKTIIETATGDSLATNDDVAFLAAGGNSLTAIRLSRMIQDDLGITVPISVLFDPEMNLKRLTEFAQDPSSKQENAIITRLYQDAELEFNSQLGKAKALNTSPSMVFITGATGYVGAYLLSEMLRTYPINCKFVCLVRCEPSTDPLDRIRENLIFLRLWQDDFQDRIVPLRGDLAKTRLGLDDKIYQTLAIQTDIIFHCGAIVNFFLPYSQLYPSNVCGTREVIHLATHTSNFIPVQYISTISVLPSNITHEVNIDQISPKALTNGYGQSKWVAEKLMDKAYRLGLPVAIYRLGSMGSDSRSGACNLLDINTILVDAILKIGFYPEEAVNTKLNTLPIDFAAQSIVHLSTSPQTFDGKVAHIIHPDGGLLFSNVIASAHQCGIQLDSIPFEQWRTRLIAQKKSNRSFESLLEFPSDSLFSKQSILSSTQFYQLVSSVNIPAMDNSYVIKWLTFILVNAHSLS